MSGMYGQHFPSGHPVRNSGNLLAEEKGLHAYSSFEEVLNDPQVDLVTVAIPNDQHRDVCIQAMEAGKNVICEKPVA